MKLKSVKKKMFLETQSKKKKISHKTGTNQPQNRNFDRQLSKHPTVFEYAHDYLDNRLTKWLGVWDEKAPKFYLVSLSQSGGRHIGHRKRNRKRSFFLF